MSTTPYKIGSLLWNDGEGITKDDLNDSQKFLQFKAWDAAGQYSKAALALSNVSRPFAPGTTFPTRFSSPAAWGGVAGGPSFVHGPDLAFTGIGTATLTVQPGYVGQNKLATRATNIPSMRWTHIDTDGGSPTFPVAPNAGPGARYDILALFIGETDGDNENRDFKDATTGVLSTSSLPKRRRQDATLLYYQGTPGAGTPVGLLAAGDTVLCVVKVADGAAVIEEIFDYTYPIGSVEVEEPIPAYNALWDGFSADWTRKGGGSLIAAAGPTDPAYFTPTSFGNPHARILGVTMNYKLSVGSTVHLTRLYMTDNDAPAGVSDVDVSSFFTMDNVDRRDRIDCTSVALLASAPSQARAPLWASSTYQKLAQCDYASNTLGARGWALKVTAATVGDIVRSVSWQIAK